MTALAGVDSAFGPTLAQASAARAQGIAWWGFYIGGPGAYHVWSDAEIAVLGAAGFTRGLPIWVPRLDLSGDPVADYAVARARARALGWFGPIALDTEASMRGLARLRPYVDEWNGAAAAAGDPEVIYEGGNYYGSAHCWSIWPGDPPAGGCHQTGLFTTVAGVSCDSDSADAAFPLASFGLPAPTPQEDDVTAPFIELDLAVRSDGTPDDANLGHTYVLNTATGSVAASFGAPFVPYGVLGSDGNEYHFGPALNGGVFAYPGLPAVDRQGARTFTQIWRD